MDGPIFELIKAGKSKKVEELLKQHSDEEVVECVTRFISKGKGDPLPLIKCIISASLDNDSKSIKRCICVYLGIIRLLQKNEINSKTAFGIVSLLLTEIDAVQPECLTELAQFYVDLVKHGTISGGKDSELLSRVLSLIHGCESIPRNDGPIKGTELKGHLINSICSSRWTPAVAIHLAPLFQQIPLTSEELKFVIEKILRLFKNIDLPDQPAVVFQLLLLSAKENKRLVIEGISDYYTAQDDANQDRSIMTDSEDLMTETTCLTTLRQVEGTVLLHITQAVRQDQELGTELIKYLKILQQSSTTKVISPFNLSLLLSISQIHYFEEQIFEFLKSSILKSFRDEERQKQSLWIRECYPCGTNTEVLVLDAVEHSTYDWDNVTPGLVKLGFGLMDSFGPKLVFGAIPESIPSAGKLTPTQQACRLGRRMLLKTFKAHEVVRSEILDQLFNFIIMKSTLPVMHYRDLLSDIVHSAPQLLLESNRKIQDLFMELTQLPPKCAEDLLSALQPLLKFSPMIKDSLILILRKALFSRQLDSRKIGALGFLMILMNFRVVGSLPSSQVSQPIALSQLQVDVHSRYNAASNEALCLEILGNLRRCLIQQADIRLSIYQGLNEVLHRNSLLMNPVLDMLLSQLKKYYEANEETCPPLRLEPCIISQVDQVFLAEPLAHLIACIQHCVLKSADIIAKMAENEDDDDDQEQQSLKQLQIVLASLTKRIIGADMEDFELDKSAEFSLANGVGVKNNIYAILLLGIYEVLMEYAFATGKYSDESCQIVLQLLSKYMKLSAVLKEKSTMAAGKKGGKPSSSKGPTSLLSFQCVVNFLHCVIDDHSTENKEGIDHLRTDKEFLPYIVNIALQKLGQMAQKGYCDGENKDPEKNFQKCCILGRLFYLHYVENQVTNDKTAQRDKKVTSQCLEGLGLVVDIASSNGVPALLQCLVHLEKESEEQKDHLRETNAAMKIHTHVKKFQRLVSTILNEDREHLNWKEMSTLLAVIASMSFHIPKESQEYQQVFSWILKVATDQITDDASTCKQLLSVLLEMAKQTKSLPQLLRNICQDIHSQLGDIEQDCEVEDKTHFSITKAIHCPTANILTLVLHHLDNELDDVEWTMKRHKAEMLAAAVSSNEARDTQVETMDRSVCTRLGVLVNGFSELTHSAVKTRPCSHMLLKSLTKLYNTLTSLTKHYISMYTHKAGHLGSRFEKLITLVGKQLNQPAYNMIIYVQAAEAEHVEEQKDKGKKKSGGSAQTGMANAIKQMKTVPNLIFAIEQLEKFLIQLSKKSKLNLMENIRLSTSRDFRINPKTVSTVVDQGMSSDNDSEAEKDDDDCGGDNEVAGTTKGGNNSDSEQESRRPCEEEQEEPPAKKKKKQTVKSLSKEEQEEPTAKKKKKQTVKSKKIVKK